MKQLFPISIFLLLTVSCTSNEKYSGINTNKYDSLEIKLGDAFVPLRAKYQHFDTDSGEYLSMINVGQNNIETINLVSQKWSPPIHLNKEGPNGIGIHNGFRILTLDCLIVASIPPNLRFLDFEGNLKRSIPIKDPENSVNYLTSDNRLPFLFGDGVLYGAQPFIKNIFETTADQVQKSKIIYKVNLKEEKTDWLSIYRPNDVWENGKKDLEFNWTDRYDSILISPISDSKIWIISKKEEKILGYKDVKSKLVNKYDLNHKRPSGDEGMIEALANDRYELLLHDPYRDVFYRFFYIGVDWEQFNMTVRNLFSNRPKVGLMILDKNLEILGEHVFQEHKVETWNYFVGPKGLYVSTNNFNRDDFDENVLRYDILRFSGLKYED